jgi:hypothetical protein
MPLSRDTFDRRTAALPLALAAAVVLLPAVPLGVDLPTHAAMGALLADPGPTAPLVETSWTATTQLFVRLVQAFAYVLPPMAAAKAAQLVSLAIATSGAWRLARATDAPPGTTAAFAAAASVGFCFVFGFSNFVLGLALSAHTLASGVRSLRTPGLRAPLVTAALLFATAHAHAIVAGMTLCQLGAFAILPPFRSPYAPFARLTRAVLPALPAAAFAAYVLARVRDREETVRAGSGLMRRAPLELLGDLASTSFGTLSPTAVLPFALLVLAWAAALRSSEPTTRSRAGLLLALVPWLLAWAVTPFHLPAWAYAQPRLLAFFLVVAPPLVLAALPREGRARHLPLLALGGLVIHLGATAWCAHAEGARTARVLSTVQPASDASPPGRILTLRLDGGERPRSPLITPWLHLDAWVAAEGGVPASWAPFNRWMHSVRPRADVAPWDLAPATYVYRSLLDAPEEARAGLRLALADRAAWQGLAFDTILAPGCEQDLRDRMALRGHRAVAPCRWRTERTQVTVTLEAPAGESHVVQVLVVWQESLGPIAGVQTLAPSGGPIPVGIVPAGPATLRIQHPSGAVLRELPLDVAGPHVDLTVSLP